MKRAVFNVLCGVVLAATLLPLAGCETLYQTSGENLNMVADTTSNNLKMLPMDTERLLFLDRPSWLSPTPMPWFY
jgi:hypothetical protein